jgi:hypothetical protein
METRKPLKRGQPLQQKSSLKRNSTLKRSSKGLSKSSKTLRAKAKDRAWDAFSAYIRTRDCLRFTGDSTQGKCVTCNRSYPYKELQAGHFIAGRGNAVLFDDRLVFSQCFSCNGNPPFGKGGNYVEYFRFMLDEVGLEKIDEYRALKHETRPYKIHDFVEIEQKYKELTFALLSA